MRKDILGFIPKWSRKSLQNNPQVLEAVNHANAIRGLFILAFGVIAEIFLIIEHDAVNIIYSGWFSEYGLYYLILHTIMLFASLFGFIRAYQYLKHLPSLLFKKIGFPVFSTLYPFIFLVCIAITNSLDQRYSDSITLYVAYMLLVGSLVLLRPRASLFVFGLSHIVFIVGMILSQQDSTVLYMNLINASLIMVCCVVINGIFYLSYYEVTSKSLMIEEVNRKLEVLSSTDPLTNLYNRRYFYQYLEANQSKLLSGKNACVLLDIDAFKSINDLYGHIVGDQALVLFGSILKEECRNLDIAVRWGGEEFLLLMFDTDATSAQERTERILKSLTDQFSSETKLDVSLTTSAGIKIFESTTPSAIDMIISHTDDALYLAKENGKNRVCIWNEETPSKQ